MKAFVFDFKGNLCYAAEIVDGGAEDQTELRKVSLIEDHGKGTPFHKFAKPIRN